MNPIVIEGDVTIDYPEGLALGFLVDRNFVAELCLVEKTLKEPKTIRSLLTIFRYKFSRTLWIALGTEHLRSQQFIPNILELLKRSEKGEIQGADDLIGAIGDLKNPDPLFVSTLPSILWNDEAMNILGMYLWGPWNIRWKLVIPEGASQELINFGYRLMYSKAKTQSPDFGPLFRRC